MALALLALIASAGAAAFAESGSAAAETAAIESLAAGLSPIHLKALRRAEELARRGAALAEDGLLDEAELAYCEALLLLPRAEGAEAVLESWRDRMRALLQARETAEELPEGDARPEDAAPLFPEPWNLSMSASEKALLIRLPAVSLREVCLEEALAFLQAASAVHDLSPVAAGVALVLNEPETRSGTRVTLRLVRATLEEAIRQTAEQAACDLRYERTQVLLIPREGESPPSLAAKLEDLAESPAARARGDDLDVDAAEDRDGPSEPLPTEPPPPAPEPAAILLYRGYLLLSAADEADVQGDDERFLRLRRDAVLPLTLLGELFPDYAPDAVGERLAALKDSLDLSGQ